MSGSLAGSGPHPHHAPEEWRDDGKCIWKSCHHWRSAAEFERWWPSADKPSHHDYIHAGICPEHRIRVLPDGRCPEAPSVKAEQALAVGLSVEGPGSFQLAQEYTRDIEAEIVEALQDRLEWFRNEAEVRDIIRIVRATIRRTGGE